MQRITWTRELVNKFWEGVWQSRLRELSFSRGAGPLLLNFVSEYIKPGTRCLDFGAGSGELIRILLQRGCQAAAYEPSPERREQLLSADFSAHPGFIGVVDENSEERFDVVFLAEVIEHILDSELSSALAEVKKSIKPGGILIVTTPNSEDLDLNSVYCPVSDVFFHRWQHVRSFTPESLAAKLSEIGIHQLHDHRVDFSSVGEMYEKYLMLLREVRVMRWTGPFYFLFKPLLFWYLKKKNRGDLRIGSQANLIFIGQLPAD